MDEIKQPRGRPRLLAQHLEASNRLKMRRLDLGLSVTQVADKLGIPYSKYRHFETQFSSSAQDQYLDALGSILSVGPKWISEGDSESLVASKSPINFVPLTPKICRELREALALRAFKRRKAIELSRSDIALQLNLKPEDLAVAERCIPAKLTADLQELWELALRVPPGWLMDHRIETPDVQNGPECHDIIQYVQSENGGSVAVEIASVSVWLSRKSIARRTLDYSQLNDAERIWANIFSARYGVNGEESSTLESIGQKIGLTRERVRQIVKKMTDRSLDLEIATPKLDRLKLEVANLAPASISEIDERLRDLLGQSLSVRSAQRFAAEILARNVAMIGNSPWRQKSMRPDMVMSGDVSESNDFMRIVRSCALKMIRNTGAAQVHFVAGAVSEEMGKEVSARDVRTTCSLVKGFTWLVEEDDWFWFGDDYDNRLLSVTKKVLAAASRRVDVEDIYAAIGRSQRGYYKSDDAKPYSIDAPVAVVLQALSRVSWINTVQKNDFVLAHGIAPNEVLSEVEFSIYELIQSKNGVTTKYNIDRHIESTLSVTPMAVAIALSRSPIFIQPGHGLYSIRGIDINPNGLFDAIQSARGPESKQNATFLHYTDNGFHKWEFVFTEYQQKTHILGVPASLARFMKEGEYIVDGWRDPVTYVDRGKDKGKFIRSLVRKIMLQGIKVGDTGILYVNPKTRCMRFEIEIGSHQSLVQVGDGVAGPIHQPII